jgi:hypothetical protein
MLTWLVNAEGLELTGKLRQGVWWPEPVNRSDDNKWDSNGATGRPNRA